MPASNKFHQMILDKLNNINLFYLNLFLIFIAVVSAMICVSGFSYFFHGQIMLDYVISGFVTAVLISAGIIPIIIYCIKLLRSSGVEYRNIQRYLSNIFDAMSDGIFLVDIDSAAVLDVNPAGCKQYGYTQSEFLAKKVYEVETSIPDLESWRAIMKRFEGQDSYTYEGLARRKDGSTFAQEVSVKVHTDPRNNHRYIIAVLRDISWRKEEKARMENIFNLMSDGLFIIDAETSRFLQVNPQACLIFGYTKEELLERHVYNVDTQVKDLASWHQLMERLKTVESYIIEGEGIRKDKRLFPIEISSRYSQDTLDGRRYIISVVRDLTGRKKLEKELEEVQLQVIQNERLASIGQLAAGVAHEINNPLGFVSSNIETLGGYIKSLEEILSVVQQLQDELEAGEDRKAHEIQEKLAKLEKDVDYEFIKRDLDDVMKESRDGVDRIKSIIANLRVFSRKGSDEASVIKIESVLDSILDILANEIKFKADLHKDYGQTSKTKGSTQQLGQVFMNILLNAVQAMKGRGVITVRTFDKDGYVCVEIADTGEGIAEKDLGHIFDAFYTTKSATKGTGLGLTISREIIRKHEGEILVKSAVGQGTTFTVKLPASK